MNYNFFNYNYNLTGINESYVRVFTKTGIQRDIHVDSFYNSNIEITDYLNCKAYFDNALFTYLNHDGINEGLFLGYVWYEYDTNYMYLCLTDNATFFSMVYSGSSSIYLDGYVMDTDDLGAETYLGLQNAITRTINSGYVKYANYTYIEHMEFNTNLSTRALLFDYQLSSNSRKSRVYDDGMTIEMPYSSCFRFDANNDTSFKFGQKVTYTEEQYINGINDYFDLGYDSGRNAGYSDGYSKGYVDGVATGGDVTMTGLNMVGGAIEQFTPVFGLEVLPNITLGTLISIPVICSIIVIIFRIARG